VSENAIRPRAEIPRTRVALALLLLTMAAGCGDDAGAADAAESHWDAAQTADSSVAAADARAADANPALAPRVGFQYLGSDGASQYLDDVLVVDQNSATVIDEGFEGGEVPSSWDQRVYSPLYSWEIVDSAAEAHSGSSSAKVTWYQNQNEWLITPILGTSGSWTVTFWTRGSVDLAEAATLHVKTTCVEGADWQERYVFPGDGAENFVWHEETFEFSCP